MASDEAKIEEIREACNKLCLKLLLLLGEGLGVRYPPCIRLSSPIAIH